MWLLISFKAKLIQPLGLLVTEGCGNKSTVQYSCVDPNIKNIC